MSTVRWVHRQVNSHDLFYFYLNKSSIWNFKCKKFWKTYSWCTIGHGFMTVHTLFLFSLHSNVLPFFNPLWCKNRIPWRSITPFMWFSSFITALDAEYFSFDISSSLFPKSVLKTLRHICQSSCPDLVYVDRTLMKDLPVVPRLMNWHWRIGHFTFIIIDGVILTTLLI